MQAGGQDLTTGDKFEIIERLLQAEENVLNVQVLCEVAGVSRSGFYAWKAAAPAREAAELQDQEDFQKIVEAYNRRGYPKGARGIYMSLLHLPDPVCMNLKKIRR